MAREAMLEKAKTYIKENNLAEAKTIIDSLLALDPSDRFAHFELGKIYQMQGNDIAAENEYKEVVKLDKNFHEASLELARIFYRQGRLGLALDTYNRVLPGMASNLDIYKELGRLCEDMKSPQQALESLSSAAKLCPDNTEIMFELARSMREAGREKEAIPLFKSILEKPAIKLDKFFYNKTLNELEITQRKEVLESKVRAMIAMVIDRCNIHCRICHIWKGSWQARDSIIKEIVELFPYMEDICWEGGEIFMMKGFEEILAEGQKHKNLKQVIFTNGLMLNEKILNTISNGRADIVFSIDAVTKETYEHIRSGAKWERLLKVLELVKEFRKTTGATINTYFNPVIMRTNHEQLVDFIEFGKKYEFNAITFTPIRGKFDEENIFESKDEKALQLISESLSMATAKAREYGIKLNNWLPVNCKIEPDIISYGKNKDTDNEASAGFGEQTSCPTSIDTERRMICYSPWQRLTIDSGGPVRPFAFCLNKFAGDTEISSLSEIWNGDGMRYYRRKIAGNDYSDLCQSECVSGQVRDKICRIT
jgi:MoaA/NifB/PqqE/SkfB family radical SAM enzyme/Flp pilus assembly protein TadD